MIATTSQPSLTNTATSNNNNTEMEQHLNDSLNTSTTINTDNIQDFDFIITDPDVKMQFKKSRDYNFIPSFPKVLYTLTWKHKYDLKISSEKPIFQGVPQKLMMSQIKIELVMGRDFSTPSYDHSKVRQRDRTVNEESRKKRPHRKPNESETTTLTSVSKENDYSIVVRFGINRTFCSKRFNYAPFRLRLDFESDKNPFTLFTPIFHTFAKKLTGFTVVNVNEILKKNGEALLPVENTDEVCTDLVGVYRPSIPVEYGDQSEQGESVASSSRTGASSKDASEPEATNEDANLLLSLGGLL
ncbi:predicted protein [Naegleria gruberi]|uniref:Predicted protein n=1 Tax=Naegleria gruberi TaxID=5762 RepID=D2VRT2_NAEGR|nr:uncharacterized protein NAEGRDRAFT_51747 [Naegleria gruberi]EFC40445.1 predicted protein [Naegleria gruberi]|eukprot:XP_002673189.1 predicted protein [Naegleria gruberi strain NEG-M]